MAPINPPFLPAGPATAPAARPAPRAVEILTFPDAQLLDVAGPLQVFSSANERLLERGLPPSYAPRVVARHRSIATTAGLALAAEPLPDGPPPGEGVAIDTLLVAGGRGVLRAMEDAALVAWLRRRAGAARRVASVCTGAFLLAEAGLLDGRRAATHWHHCAELARRFPAVRVDPDPIFLRDGGVWTSAGVTAGIDLALALVEEDVGRAVALAVARQLVVFLKRPGGQAQFSAALDLQSRDERFARLHEWIGAHLTAELTMARLAAEAGMSERSFARRYRAATGMTPGRAVERLRVEAARHLLAESTLPVKRVAALAGFGAEETMRRSFLRTQGIGPRDYRERFSPA